MSLFDGVLGGIVGAGMVGVVSRVIDQHGGLQGVVSQFEKQGFADTVKSWVGTGPNQQITADQLHAALGASTLQEIAAHAGISVAQLAQKLALALPQAIDKLTPQGVLPKA
jgi:uncharacterized protein YidB (DUF937 family)